MDGFYVGDPAGLPRFADSTMRGEYPFVWINFEDPEAPCEVSLEAFTPLVPLDADDSGIPCAVLRYKVTNRRPQPLDVAIAGSLVNAIGFQRNDPYFPIVCEGTGRNEIRETGPVRGLALLSDLPADHLGAGTMALATRDEAFSAKAWLNVGWWEGLKEFWKGFKRDGRLAEPGPLRTPPGRVAGLSNLRPVGSLAVRHELAPGEEQTFEFLLTWHFPNRERRWNGFVLEDDDLPGDGLERNHYATRFEDAWDVARHLGTELERLEGHTRDFHRAFFGTTLPAYVLDAVASNLTVIRSPTCFRIEDGTLLGWEGGFYQRGSCEGSCTHVWDYAQTMAFLFPELERSMRRVEFLLETDEEGAMAFRSNRVFGRPRWDFPPAADGQLGTIVRLYREWRLSGDEEFARELWPAARRALDFALDHWDADGDLVLDGEQHNTYDIEFYGPNSLTAPLLVAALLAGAKIAGGLGEADLAARYADLAARSSARADELLWNGEYYAQKLDDVDAYRYQYGEGCLSDQLLGPLIARLNGLGDVLPAERTRAATEAVRRHNFRDSMFELENFERVYAINDERGLVVCSWPRGGEPQQPLIYADEVFTGIEYTVAALSIYQGAVEAGLEMVRAVRERHDGYKRNPWNEAEAGDHYARSLASWGVYAALCGSEVDLVEGTLRFTPAISAEEFSAFFICGRAWGVYRQSIDPSSGAVAHEVEVLYGDLDGIAVNPDRAAG